MNNVYYIYTKCILYCSENFIQFKNKYNVSFIVKWFYCIRSSENFYKHIEIAYLKSHSWTLEYYIV